MAEMEKVEDMEELEEKYQLGFEIISFAGNSKSLSIMAVEAAGKGEFEQAEQYLKEAAENMVEAHEIQTQMLRDEINGKCVEINILMVHAQDHLTMATMAQENAVQFIKLHREIAELKKNCCK